MLLAAAALVLGQATESPREDPRNHASWWIATYGVADRTTPNLVRAEGVFERVASAADKKSNRLPRLVVIALEEESIAMALPDGSVILTEKVLDLCYRGMASDAGDAGLAFVLGHELAHLAKDDFWHAAAFDGSNPDLRSMTPPPPDGRATELQADDYGLLYLTIAGFEAGQLLRKDNPFFRRWASQPSTAGVYAAGAHPTPEKRAAFLRSRTAQVANELDLFHFGTRLHQLDRNEDAILLLERFREKFPSREVLNNLGLAHLSIGFRYLERCDMRLITRFKLPSMTDPVSRASTAAVPRLRSWRGSSECLQADPFRRRLDEAIRYFERANEMDPGYLPSRLNLLAALIVSEQGAKALGMAEEATLLDPTNVEAASARAVAIYLYGQQTTVETADSALRILRDLAASHPGVPSVRYNLASMLDERGRRVAAEEAWDAFLRLEPTGIHADHARQFVGSGAAKESEETASRRTFVPPTPPLPLGELSRSDGDGWTKESIVVGDFRGDVLRRSDAVALVIDSIVEIVEDRPARRLTEQQALEDYGSPERIVPGYRRELWYYPNFAIEMASGVLHRRVYFRGH